MTRCSAAKLSSSSQLALAVAHLAWVWTKWQAHFSSFYRKKKNFRKLKLSKEQFEYRLSKIIVAIISAIDGAISGAYISYLNKMAHPLSSTKFQKKYNLILNQDTRIIRVTILSLSHKKCIQRQDATKNQTNQQHSTSNFRSWAASSSSAS